MRLLIARRLDDFFRRQPDSLINDLHSGITRLHGDLLRAVGMAVQPRLADEKRQSPAELAGNAVDVGAEIVEPGDVIAPGAPNASRRAVFAESLAQCRSPSA